jgi:phosphoglycolate phosphatase
MNNGIWIMSNNLRLVVFDCDGTIVDSKKAILELMSATFEMYDLDVPDKKNILRGVGLELSVGIKRLLSDDCEVEIEALCNAYRHLARDYRENGEHQDPLYPNADNIIRALDQSNWLLGIATGKARVGLDHVLNLHGISDLFITKQTSDTAAGKPNPEMLQNAMADTGVERDLVFMVGDTTFDINMAKNAGAKAIGVSWGYHETEELLGAGADLVVDSYDELFDVLQRMSRV